MSLRWGGLFATILLVPTTAVLVPTTAVRGAVVAYDFTGRVTQDNSGSPLLGLTVTNGDPVTGRISYVYPDTVPDDTTGGYHLYTEAIVDGFSAIFLSGGTPVEVRTSDYAVQVRNDVGGFDGFSAVYSPLSQIVPTAPITIGSNTYTNVNFRVDLLGSSALYSGPEVPPSLALSNFMPISFFRLGSLGASDSLGSILFEVTDLQPAADPPPPAPEPAPEPSALALLMMGTGAFVCLRSMRKWIGLSHGRRAY